jgi:hypothetical protein
MKKHFKSIEELEKSLKGKKVIPELLFTDNPKTKKEIKKISKKIDKLFFYWCQIEKLNKELKFSNDCYDELKTRIFKKLASLEGSIQELVKIDIVIK